MILHLVDDRGPQTSPMTLALLADTIEGDEDREHHVLLLGGQALRDSARAVGVDRAAASFQVLGLPMDHPVLAPTALLRRLWRFRRARSIHAWSDTALSTAALFAPRIPRVVHITQPPTLPASKRLLRQMYHAGMDVHVIDESLIQTLERIGLPAGRVHLTEPMFDTSRLADASPREVMRSRWDWGNNESTVAWMTDAPSRTDARDAALLLGLLCETLPGKIQLLVHPGTPRLWSGIDQLQPHGNSGRLVQEPLLARPWKLLPCIDQVVLAHGASLLSRRWAEIAGIPIIAPTSQAASPRHLAQELQTSLTP
jgi:hypothetical protein